eukprot:COSAG02_NODE_11380_length_1735_cov_12.444988_1_plen_104_part_00
MTRSSMTCENDAAVAMHDAIMASFTQTALFGTHLHIAAPTGFAAFHASTWLVKSPKVVVVTADGFERHVLKTQLSRTLPDGVTTSAGTSGSDGDGLSEAIPTG